MRTHLQGTFLLVVLLLGFWWMLTWAVPILDAALFGEDGAIVARAAPESDGTGDQFGSGDLPLDGDEVAVLQGALIRVGYSPGPIDGILGTLTREAIDEAKVDLGLADASDRGLLEALESAVEALDRTADSGDATTDITADADNSPPDNSTDPGEPAVSSTPEG